MTALEKIRAFVRSYPRADILQDFRVDFTDQIPANGGIFPSGLVEVKREADILGDVTVTNQYNFGLYYVFEKAPKDDVSASANADWLMDFQEWVQEQSARGKAPVFGDVPRLERITAQNGEMYTSQDEGLAVYAVQLTVLFVKEFQNDEV